ncbi:hypothetical protein LPJ60_002168, partial [Coemansia sp. RSA 2675]
MPTLSIIQLLPLHVIEQIVGYIVGSSRMVFDGVFTDSQEYKELLKPLLWVSSDFRTVALPLYCNYFKVIVSTTAQADQNDHGLLERQSSDHCVSYRYLGHPTHHLTKDLKVQLEGRAIYSGQALAVLSGAPYDGCAFPLVRRLTVTLTEEVLSDMSEDVEIDLLRAKANIGEFVERIKQIAPAVRDIRVQLRNQHSPEVYDHHVGYLVSRLLRLVGRINYDYEANMTTPIWPYLYAISNLTHFTYTSVSGEDHFMQTVRHNAPTLQALDIDIADEFIDVKDLVQNTDGSYITYPQLRKLCLCWGEDGSEHRRAPLRGAIPFPRLERLVVIPEYPFGDDVMLRGNAGTLKLLHLKVSCSDISMLRRLDVFTPTSYPRLQYVNIECSEWGIPGVFASPTDYAQFVLGIGPKAHMRRIKVISAGRSLLSTLSAPGTHSCIQILKLPSLELSLRDILLLVSSLPLLSDLHTHAPTIDPLLNGTSMDEILV